MSSKRSPQTAAKRAREQAVREKRERKEAKKLARATAEPEPGSEQALMDQPLGELPPPEDPRLAPSDHESRPAPVHE